MTRPLFSAVLLLLALGVPAPAQNTMTAAKEEIKPADPPSKVLLDAWNDGGRKIIAMAEDFPEDKLDYKPNPAQRSFAEQLLHIAGANYYLVAAVKGDKPADGDPKRDDFKSRADIVNYVKKSFAEGAALIESKGDKGFSDFVVDPFAHKQFRFYELGYGLSSHTGEHYGQLVVYYRVLGLVPPESRPKK